MSRIVRLAVAAVVVGASLDVAGAVLLSSSPAQASTLPAHPPGLVFTKRSVGPAVHPVGIATRSAAAKTLVPKITKNPSSVTVALSHKATFKANASGKPTPTVQWEMSTDGGDTFTPISGATGKTYAFTPTAGQNGDQFEAVFTNSVGTATTTAATLTIRGVPVVTTDPASTTVVAGATATFTAAATGKPTPTVQWEVSTDGGDTFTPVSGATATTYAFTTTAGENGDEFEAVFTNSAGTATTAAAILAVTTSATAPVVTTDPSNATVATGATATFTAAASGTPTPTVQWEVSTDGGDTFTPVSGATATTYAFTTTAGENGDEYEAVFTNSAGTATTTAAILTIGTLTTAPSVTTDPASTTVASGATATFTAAASGTPTPTVQWEVSTDGGDTFTPVSGATATTYAVTTTAGENGDEYEAVFTNSAGAATTTAAILTVTTAPVVSTDPASTTVASGATATFTAAATGTPTPTVQWEVSTNEGDTFTPVSGATATTYAFTTTAGENGDEYEAVFTNSVGAATTTAAILTVTTSATAPVVSTDPASTTVASGATATFTAAATGTPTPTVQWEVSTNGGDTFTPVSGATATTYAFTTTAGENGDEYEAVFTNSAGTATTTAAILTITTAPSPGGSTNWSGYADTGATFTAVTGDWTVPGVTCTGTRSTYSSVWIGIDGDVSSTVEQDGTEADCINGTPSYDAWYELYGDNSQNDGSEIELSTTSYPVVPGDEMAAAVSETGSVWTFALSDTSTQHPDWSYTSGGIAFAAAQSSAEWIVERPELCGNSCSLTSLADFGTAGVSDATTTTSSLVHAPIDAFSSTDIQMTNSAGTKVLAQPSALGAGGTSFTDTWEAAG